MIIHLYLPLLFEYFQWLYTCTYPISLNIFSDYTPVPTPSQKENQQSALDRILQNTARYSAADISVRRTLWRFIGYLVVLGVAFHRTEIICLSPSMHAIRSNFGHSSLAGNDANWINHIFVLLDHSFHKFWGHCDMIHWTWVNIL